MKNFFLQLKMFSIYQIIKKYFICLAMIIIVITILIITNKIIINKNMPENIILLKELNKLTIPNSTVIVYKTYRYRIISVESEYKTKLNYLDIVKFYDAEFLKNGWIFKNDNITKSIDGCETDIDRIYQKGTYIAILDYDIQKDKNIKFLYYDIILTKSNYY